jgi:predicted secreted Zn-dependent protease
MGVFKMTFFHFNVRRSRSFIITGIYSLLLIAFPFSTFAADGQFRVARIDKDIRPGTHKRVALPLVTERYEYYEIRGRSEKELRCQMCRNGCLFRDGSKYDSLTTWRWKMAYGYDRIPGSCAADSFTVTLEISYRYPKWMNSQEAPRPLVEKWDAYLENLVTHENGHRDMAVKATKDLSRAIADLPPAVSCADLDRELRSLSHERMEKLNEEEEHYDVTTLHGKTQGAIFP